MRAASSFLFFVGAISVEVVTQSESSIGARERQRVGYWVVGGTGHVKLRVGGRMVNGCSTGANEGVA